MHVVKLFHREVVVAVHEAAGDVLVERVGEHRRLDARIGGVTPDQLVPSGLGVEHRRPQLTVRLHAGSGEPVVGYARGLVAEPADAERVGEAPRRIDGEHEHPTADLGGGVRRERRRHRRLADAP